MRLGIAGLMGLAVACGGDRGGDGAGDGGVEITASAGDAGEAGDGTGNGDDGGTRLDVGMSDTPELGCTKVDFLFVIDNSISMSEQQTALKAAFPGFMQTIEETVGVSDFHIMVADTDAEGRCTPTSCANGLPHSTCNDYACTDQFDTCDTTRGAGVVHPAGQGATNSPCQIMGGNRYIVEGEPDLTATFECMATVGLAGNASERPMDGIVEALAPAINGPGGCNDGFLRDDAILVVTFISDDPNVEDTNSAQQAFDAVVAAKGDPESVVVLGLIPELPPVCTGDNKPDAGLHWAEFIGMFGTRGIQGSVCAADYNPFFQDAVSTIDDTCTSFEG